MAFWMENPNWHSGVGWFDLACKAVQALPFSPHELQKRAFYDTEKVLAVNGETVVAVNGPDKVDKFMFRYPGRMALTVFGAHVYEEVASVTEHLAGVALPTRVDIKEAQIFRRPKSKVPAVVQIQERLDLDVHTAMDLAVLSEESKSPLRDRTAQDIEKLLEGTGILVTNFGYYPDLANNSGNLRRSVLDGAVSLIDVMPFYADGSRLIGDNPPPNVIPHIQDNIQSYEKFVGEYGG
jgi:hypothetical protein